MRKVAKELWLAWYLLIFWLDFCAPEAEYIGCIKDYMNIFGFVEEQSSYYTAGLHIVAAVKGRMTWNQPLLLNVNVLGHPTWCDSRGVWPDTIGIKWSFVVEKWIREHGAQLYQAYKWVSLKAGLCCQLSNHWEGKFDQGQSVQSFFPSLQFYQN